MERDKYFKTVVRRMIKYEKALIGIACFQDGEYFSSMDEPGSAKDARDTLGKKMCKQILRKIEDRKKEG